MQDVRGVQSTFCPWTATIMKILSEYFFISENADSHCTDYWGEVGKGVGEGRHGGKMG